MMEATGAELSATPLFNNASGFLTEVTMRELVNTYRFDNSLVVKKISGKTLRDYLEKTARFWSIDNDRIVINPQYLRPKEKLYFYDMVDGCEYTIKVSNDPGSRITSLTVLGEDVTDDMEFTICINSFRAAGGGNYEMLKQAPTVAEIHTSLVELIALWIMEHQVIDFEPVDNITVIK
jgi:2',3'-cyclic-nucleotide 2'-phosphodiesterase/3'-nucleotidase